MNSSFARRIPALLSILLFAHLPANSNAEIVVFDVGGNGTSSVHGQPLHGQSSGVATALGSSFSVTMSASTLLLQGSRFNLVSQGLAIRSNGLNQSDQIDASFVPITSDQPLSDALQHEGFAINLFGSEPMDITILGFQFEGITFFGGDQVELVNSLGNITTVDSSNVNQQGFVSLNEAYLGGNYIIRHSRGNGFRVQRLILDINLESVPEPGSLVSFLLAMLVVTRRPRRRQQTLKKTTSHR